MSWRIASRTCVHHEVIRTWFEMVLVDFSAVILCVITCWLTHCPVFTMPPGICMLHFVVMGFPACTSKPVPYACTVAQNSSVTATTSNADQTHNCNISTALLRGDALLLYRSTNHSSNRIHGAQARPVRVELAVECGTRTGRSNASCQRIAHCSSALTSAHEGALSIKSPQRSLYSSSTSSGSHCFSLACTTASLTCHVAFKGTHVYDISMHMSQLISHLLPRQVQCQQRQT